MFAFENICLAALPRCYYVSYEEEDTCTVLICYMGEQQGERAKKRAYNTLEAS
jgi:hypothetical protein